MNLVCNGCGIGFHIPDEYATNGKLRLSCETCGLSIFVLGTPPNAKVIGATEFQYEPQIPQPRQRPSSQPDSLYDDQPTAHIAPQSEMVAQTNYAAVDESEYSYSDQVFEGARNEDSLLFSLSNLQDMTRHEAAQSAQNESGNEQWGYANGEGSGYIDIRALVELSRKKEEEEEALKEAENEAKRVAEIEAQAKAPPRIESQTKAPPKPLDTMESLAPITYASQKSNKALPISIIVGSTMIIAAVAVSLSIINQGSSSAEVASMEQPVVQRVAGVNTVVLEDQKPLVAPSSVNEPVQDDNALRADQIAPVSEPSEKSSSMESPRRVERVRKGPRVRASVIKDRLKTNATERPRALIRRKERQQEASSKIGTTSETSAADSNQKKSVSIDDILNKDLEKDKKVEEKPQSPASSEPEKQTGTEDPLLAALSPAKKQPARNRSMDELLDNAVNKNDGPPSAATAGSTPETPSRAQVKRAMAKVSPAVRQCAGSQGVTGVVKISIRVDGSTGRVTSATANGVPGPVGSCISDVVRKAQFPQFTRPELSINYPVKL